MWKHEELVKERRFCAVVQGILRVRIITTRISQESADFLCKLWVRVYGSLLCIRFPAWQIISWTNTIGCIYKSYFITTSVGCWNVVRNFEEHQHSKCWLKRRARLLGTEEEQKPPSGGCCINIYTRERGLWKATLE